MIHKVKTDKGSVKSQRELTMKDIQEEVSRRALEAGYSCNLHQSMGGSEYQQIACEFDFQVVREDSPYAKWEPTNYVYVVRYANHANRSSLPGKGRVEWEFLDGQEELWEDLLSNVEFHAIDLDDVLVKKTVMAKLVGLTVPALKKRLSGGAYRDVCENSAYPNTLTQVVKLGVALKELGTDINKFLDEHVSSRTTTSVYQPPDSF